MLHQGLLNHELGDVEQNVDNSGHKNEGHLRSGVSINETGDERLADESAEVGQDEVADQDAPSGFVIFLDEHHVEQEGKGSAKFQQNTEADKVDGNSDSHQDGVPLEGIGFAELSQHVDLDSQGGKVHSRCDENHQVGLEDQCEQQNK